MKFTQSKSVTYLIALTIFFSSLSTTIPFDYVVAEESSVKSAYAVYAELQESATSFNARALMVGDDLAIEGMDAGVTYGAEKEASSSLLTRIMTPPSSTLETMVSGMPEENRFLFLKDFFSNYLKDANGYRTFKTEQGHIIDYARDITDVDGNPKIINLEAFRGIDVESASLAELEQKFSEWLSMTDDRPLSFLKPSVRTKMFHGKLPGLSDMYRLKGSRYDYSSWQATWGKAQKYIRDAHGHNGGQGGWEINFLPQQTYGEFEEMVMWFRSELKNAGKLFEAPGHQRMVFRKHPELDEARLSETYRAIQALIVIDGIQGKTGIEKANYKSVNSDDSLKALMTGRGVIRLEGERWASDTHGVEFRAGTKDIRAARFYQTVLSARVATNDFSGLVKIDDYGLYDGSSFNAQSLARRFNVPEEKAQKAIDNLNLANIKQSFTLPFWTWEAEGLPFLSGTKKKFINSLTKDFILQAAELPAEGIEESARSLMRSWTKSTKLGDELRKYLKPARMAETTSDLLSFTTPNGRAVIANPIDVNNIDLGIEYSGKFPLALDAQYSPSRLVDNKKAWLQTRIDLSSEERKAVIKKVADDLLAALGGTGEAEEVIDAGGHGHGLEVAYSIRDPKNRKWVVEWDGVGRSYNSAGEIVENSVRGGSVELVTPKFVPQVEEMEAVYAAFEKNNIMPTIKAGGGHINVDLAPFENNPKALARFMSIFHEHRGIISLMFQYVNRLKSAEPIEIDATLAQSLKNFNGSEEELKKLLYDKRYFNTRYGRKTRYNQLDVSAYFQDVIPEEFITEDFDINSPTDPWRRTFRVDPKIRKAEFRLFNAPRDPMESALQIKLVRAILSKALNEESSLTGVVQKVDHVGYLKNTEKAYQDLQKLCDDLGLDIADYRPAVAEGLSDTDMATRSLFFEPLSAKLKMHPVQSAWGEATPARSADNALNSQGRLWSPGAADEQNTMTHEARVRAALEAEEQRGRIIPIREVPGDFIRSDSCVDAAGAFL
ncbi:MAG: amidoligase family protein [Bacteriovoracaceae bacterium]|nr:amidoligase family protein [Bacteriovoracaceae bacterium]